MEAKEYGKKGLLEIGICARVNNIELNLVILWSSSMLCNFLFWMSG